MKYDSYYIFTEMPVLNLQTKRLNEQVKHNAARFPQDYMFALSETETQELVA